MNRFPLTQIEVEKPIYEIVTAKSEVKIGEIAELSETYPSVMYGMFNPQDDRKSIIFLFVRLLWALDQIGFGEQVVQWILLIRATWLPDSNGASMASVNETNETLAIAVAKFNHARLQNKPVTEQIILADKIADLAEQQKFAVIAERNAQNFAPRNETRSNSRFH